MRSQRVGLSVAGAALLGVALLGGATGCGDALCAALDCDDRDPKWEASFDSHDYPPKAVGLTSSVAVYDRPLDRVLMLTSPSSQEIVSTSVGVGQNLAQLVPSADKRTLYALSRGVHPRRHPDDERPSLTLIDGERPKRIARYELTDPLGGIAVDPLGEWVVLYDAGGVVVNPNELILVPVSEPERAPIEKTIRSFGGRPQRLTFTSELTLPSGPPRRLLVVETEQNITLVDLAFPERSEVTIELPRVNASYTTGPAQIAFHDGDPEDPNDARIAVLMNSQPEVVIVELGPSGDPELDYRARVNVAEVGGIPSALDFVMTDGGLRLAALVPNRRHAALIDLDTTVVEHVALPRPYGKLSRVTDAVTERPNVADVALLWGESSNFAFWSLGQTTGKPYRSVEEYGIDIRVTQVKDIPGQDHGHQKILEGSDASQFYVLDLDQRTSYPMLTNSQGFSLTVAPDGRRAWAVRTGTPDLAQVDLSTLHPTSLTLERDVTQVFDIARSDGGRALIVLHAVGNLGATWLDGLRPDSAYTAFYPALYLGDL
ncbi:MAG: hypothetical protein KIT72_07390 [Polyangiaceae bacterium]|nr:hypothetical protein [Polyangiaceae bacterium]MCW5790227.1 hypothetical protein [Polyangiaceae bacterium]